MPTLGGAPPQLALLTGLAEKKIREDKEAQERRRQEIMNMLDRERIEASRSARELAEQAADERERQFDTEQARLRQQEAQRRMSEREDRAFRREQLAAEMELGYARLAADRKNATTNTAYLNYQDRLRMRAGVQSLYQNDETRAALWAAPDLNAAIESLPNVPVDIVETGWKGLHDTKVSQEFDDEASAVGVGTIEQAVQQSLLNSYSGRDPASIGSEELSQLEADAYKNVYNQTIQDILELRESLRLTGNTMDPYEEAILNAQLRYLHYKVYPKDEESPSIWTVPQGITIVTDER